MPSAVLRSPILWEVADIVEQIFFIAFVEDLHPRSEEYDAATCDYAAEHGLSVTGMQKEFRQYGTLTEIHERAQVIALMRLYQARWRVWDPEGRRRAGPSRQRKRAPEKQPPKRTGRPPKRDRAPGDAGVVPKADRDKNRYREPVHH